MAETVVLNARVNPETRDELNEIINRIMEENQFKKAGEAYAELVEIVKREQSEIAPDFRNQVGVIRTNLNAILSNVMAMNEVFLAYQENQQQIHEKQQEGLIKQLNVLNENNKELEEKLQKSEKQIEALTQERDNLVKDLESYKEQLKRRDQIDELLASVNKLLEENQDQKDKLEK